MVKNDSKQSWISEMVVISLVSLCLSLLYNSCSNDPLPFYEEEKAVVGDDELFERKPRGYDEMFDKDKGLQPERTIKIITTESNSSIKDTVKVSVDRTPSIEPKAELTTDVAPVPPANQINDTRKQPEPEPQVEIAVSSKSSKPDLDIKSDIDSDLEPEMQSEFQGITKTQLKKAIGDERFMIIDARNKAAFDKDHIQGAIHIFPRMDDESAYMEKVLTLPRDKKFLLYCNGPLCDLAEELATRMSEFGYEDIYIYFDGWEGWTDQEAE
jgi:rhodanese-related sulfurtransferase